MQLRRSSQVLILFLGAAVAAAAFGHSAASAQQTPPAADAKAAASEDGAKPDEKPMADALPLDGEIMPRVFMLKDKDGKLRAMPGISLEQFIEAYKIKNQLDQQNQQPKFAIENLALSGTATGQRAELTAEFTVSIHTTGWVRVPLRLGTAVLREEAQHEGPGEHFLQLDADGDGYVSWIRSEAGKSHHLTLRLVTTLSRVGPESQLRLDVPRSNVSKLALEVPMENPVVSVSEGSTLDAQESAADGKTMLKVVGMAGECEVSWHAAESQVASLPTVMEASTEQSIRIDGRTINTEAKLTVRSSGDGFDRFQVRLPPGANYVESSQSGASIAPVDTTQAQGKLYEVKLSAKTTGPIEVRMVSQRACDPDHSGEALELAGFEVLGAVRQWGTVTVAVEGNWQIQWRKDQHVRDDLAGAFRPEDIAAAFEYSAQPYSLTARISPQKTRMRVEGEYVILVEGEEAQLRGTLRYTIRGAKIRSLEIDTAGWDIDVKGPAGVAKIDEAMVNEEGLLVVPLLQATAGDLELTFEGQQKIADGASRVEWNIPRPKVETIGPSVVAVLPADNIELAVLAEETSGLSPQTVRPQLKQLPQRQQDPLFFRATGTQSKFVASLKVYEQAISATIATQLEVDELATRVDQRIGFQIAYHPTDHLTLEVPRGVRPERLNVSLDGERLVPTVIRDPGEGEGSGPTTVRVPLAAPRIGRCELEVSYEARHEKLAGATSTLVKVPLVVPAESQITSNELAVVPKSGISVNYPKGFPVGPWVEDARSGSAGTNRLALTARRAVGEVSLAVSFKGRPVENASTVEQAWVQTHLANGHRQDRAVFRLVTTEPRLRISLPAAAELATLEVDLDGRRIKPEVDPAQEPRELVVPLAGTTRNEHRIELRYQFAERSAPGEMTLAAPQFKPAGWVQQLYWQVILPADEHVVLAPTGYTPEFRWVWQNLLWHRQSPLDERELEAWIGAAPSPDNNRLSGETPEQFAARQKTRAVATNRYLFSAVGDLQPLALYSQSRARLVFMASLPLLAFGLLLIYFPATRHPAALFAVAVLAASASLIAPEPALLVAQAASLGLVLAIGAAVLSRASARPAPRTVPVGGSSRAIERSVAEGYVRSGGSGSQPSTATNPLMHSPAPESAT